jgi:hypothetical protein
MSTGYHGIISFMYVICKNVVTVTYDKKLRTVLQLLTDFR